MKSNDEPYSDRLIRVREKNYILLNRRGWFEIWTAPLSDGYPKNTHIRIQGREIEGQHELHTFAVSGYGAFKKFKHIDSVVDYCSLPVKQSLIKEE